MLTAIKHTNTVRRTAPATRLLALGAALFMPLAGAFAQNAIPEELLRKQEIGDADRQIIRTYVELNKGGLAGTAADIKKSREALVTPLEKLGGVSVPFRVAYANALIEAGGIEKLAANKDNDLIATNALRIAGQAATGNTLKVILDGLKDTRPQVRYAATVAARAAFTAAKTNPALSADERYRALKALGDIASTDTVKEPVDGAFQAMIAAREIADNRSPALEQLTAAAGKRAMIVAKSDQPDGLATLLRVVAAVRTDMIDAGTVSADARKGSAAFAGQLLVAIGGQWKDGTDPTDTMVQAAKAAEGVLGSIDSKHSFAISDAVAPSKREQFNRSLKSILEILQGEPFSIPQSTFKP